MQDGANKDKRTKGQKGKRMRKREEMGKKLRKCEKIGRDEKKWEVFVMLSEAIALCYSIAKSKHL